MLFTISASLQEVTSNVSSLRTDETENKANILLKSFPISLAAYFENGQIDKIRYYLPFHKPHGSLKNAILCTSQGPR